MARWTAQVFVDSNVGQITAEVEASTPQGAEQQINRIYGPVQQIVNLRQSNSRSFGGGGSAPSGGSGCAGLFWIIVGIIVLGMFGGGEDDKTPSSPSVRPSQQTMVAPPTPKVDAAFRDYPTPSYCITENFEPC